MGIYAEQVLPRCLDVVMGLGTFRSLRQHATEGLAGRVLELGFGSGLNLEWYPKEVVEVLALEPSAVAQRLARRRLERAPIPVRFVGLSGEHLPLPDGSVDAVLSTWTLCTIPGLERALAEVRRVLRPGGALHFLEHGLARDEPTRAWQRRLTPLQRKLVGGCHLDRPIGELVARSGLEIEQMEEFPRPGPKVLAWYYAGRARKR